MCSAHAASDNRSEYALVIRAMLPSCNKASYEL